MGVLQGAQGGSIVVDARVEIQDGARTRVRSVAWCRRRWVRGAERPPSGSSRGCASAPRLRVGARPGPV